MKKIKKKLNFLTIFLSGILLILLIFVIYIMFNITPKKEKFEFDNVVEDSHIVNHKVDNLSGRVSIYFELDSSIFQAYNYHSYISGDGNGEKIYLKSYLLSEDKDTCYEIKSFCYDYSNKQNLKFIASYYDKFIDTSKKYKLAIYVVDTNICYITEIEV